jgi:hypothetical protein
MKIKEAFHFMPRNFTIEMLRAKLEQQTHAKINLETLRRDMRRKRHELRYVVVIDGEKTYYKKKEHNE